MNNRKIILTLDIGTTAIKALAFEQGSMACIGSVSSRLNKVVVDNKVEQDPAELLQTSIDLLRLLVDKYQIIVDDCIGLGIANQRETTIIWNKKTGEPVYPAIVWEDKRTQTWCDEQSQEFKDLIKQKTHLELSAYFSASKIKWILDNVSKNENLIFGTVDTWILWNFDKNHVHATDHTNASRTLLYDSNNHCWSQELLVGFDIVRSRLPDIKLSSSRFGNLKKDILGLEIPILAICGDQQSSMFCAQQYCQAEVGCIKITFGTGVFLMQIVDDIKKIKDPFYPSVAVNTHATDNIWALEYKIENVGKEVDELLNIPNELERYLDRLTDKIARIICQLPIKVEEIVIDGGVTQNKSLHEMLAQKVSAKIIELPIYNGTGLGVSYLVNKSYLSR
ncbi:hypothetical protein KKH24_03075 [Patescibacteria group bacterium]|nr:hypothetical protein [Patescibacteria group bacterium]